MSVQTNKNRKSSSWSRRKVPDNSFFFQRVNKQGMVQELKEVETQKKKTIQQNVILVHYKQKKIIICF